MSLRARQRDSCWVDETSRSPHNRSYETHKRSHSSMRLHITLLSLSYEFSPRPPSLYHSNIINDGVLFSNLSFSILQVRIFFYPTKLDPSCLPLSMTFVVTIFWRPLLNKKTQVSEVMIWYFFSIFFPWKLLHFKGLFRGGPKLLNEFPVASSFTILAMIFFQVPIFSRSGHRKQHKA